MNADMIRAVDEDTTGHSRRLVDLRRRRSSSRLPMPKRPNVLGSGTHSLTVFIVPVEEWKTCISYVST